MTAAIYGANAWRLSRILDACLTKAMAPVSRAYGITVAQAQLLFSLHKNSESTVGSLAERMGVARTNASAMCKKLANMGFIKRIRRQDDERVVSLTLTERGRAAARAVERRMEKMYRRKEVDLQKMEEMMHSFEAISRFLTEEEVGS